MDSGIDKPEEIKIETNTENFNKGEIKTSLNNLDQGNLISISSHTEEESSTESFAKDKFVSLSTNAEAKPALDTTIQDKLISTQPHAESESSINSDVKNKLVSLAPKEESAHENSDHMINEIKTESKIEVESDKILNHVEHENEYVNEEQVFGNEEINLPMIKLIPMPTAETNINKRINLASEEKLNKSEETETNESKENTSVNKTRISEHEPGNLITPMLETVEVIADEKRKQVKTFAVAVMHDSEVIHKFENNCEHIIESKLPSDILSQKSKPKTEIIAEKPVKDGKHDKIEQELEQPKAIEAVNESKSGQEKNPDSNCSHGALPRRPPPPKIIEMKEGIASLGKTASHTEDQQTSHIYLPWKHKHRQAGVHSSENLADEGNKKSFGETVRSAFGTLRRSLKRKNKKQSKSKDNGTPEHQYYYSSPSTQIRTSARPILSPGEIHDSQSQLSTAPSLEPSITESPNIRRKEPSEQFIDVQMFHPTKQQRSSPTAGSHISSCPPITLSSSNQHVESNHTLKWVASAIASSIAPGDFGQTEADLNTEIIANNQPIQMKQSSNAIQTIPSEDAVYDNEVISRVKSPSKPPRPSHPPSIIMSEHPKFDASVHREVIQRRMHLVGAVSVPPDSPAEAYRLKNLSLHQSHSIGTTYQTEKGVYIPEHYFVNESNYRRFYDYVQDNARNVDSTDQRGVLSVSGSLDRRCPPDIENSPTQVRRVQTLKVADYPSRLRERVRSYHPSNEHYLQPAVDEPKRSTYKPRDSKIVAQKYECKETYNWPPKLPKFKRRQSSPPKKIRTAEEYVISRPQPQIHMSYRLPPQEPIVVAKMSPSQLQAVPKTCPPIDEHKELASPSQEFYTVSEEQMTSLRSVQTATLLDQSKRASNSIHRGELQIIENKHSPTNPGSPITLIRFETKVRIGDKDELLIPYFNDHVEKSLFPQLNRLSVDSKVIDSELSKPQVMVHKCLMAIHPFLKELIKGTPNTSDDSGSNSNEQINEQFVHKCLTEYLFTCMKLQSINLPGQYAGFHFPLKELDDKLWNKRGVINKWNTLSIIAAQNNSEYEYLVLPHESDEIQYSSKTMNKLLTNWLDNQKTDLLIPESNEPSTRNDMNTITTLHSVTLITYLDTIINRFEKQFDFSELFINITKLCVLLSLSDCLNKLKENFVLNLSPENILLTMSPSNCLVMFQKQLISEQSNQNGTNDLTQQDYESLSNRQSESIQSLVKSLCNNECEHLNEAINHLIKVLYEKNVKCMNSVNILSSLFEAIAPPDWIALTLARIHLFNQASKQD